MIEVADRLAITELYARQAQLIDGGDAAGWAETFTPDGSFESPTFALLARGRDALRDFAASSNGAALERGEQLRHWTGQYVLTREGPGRVRVEGYMLIVASSGDSSRIDRSLRFTDHLHRIGGGWLVSSRRMFRDGWKAGADEGGGR